MNYILNSTYFNYSHNIIVQPDSERVFNNHDIVSFNYKIRKYGFQLSKDAINTLSYVTNHLDILSDLYKAILSIVQITSSSAITSNSLQYINAVSPDEVKQEFINLIAINSVLTTTAYAFIISYITSNKLESNIIDNITYKETLAVVGATLLKYTNPFVNKLTATDILRIIYKSHDSSLYDIIRIKLSMRIRRFVLSALNKDISYDDMVKYRSKWIILGEILHPNSKRNKIKYPITNKHFNNLRQNAKHLTFNSQLERAYATDALQVVNLLKDRAGLFIRNMHRFIKVFGEDDINLLISHITKVAPGASINVLFQAMNYFNNYESSTVNCRIVGGNISLTERSHDYGTINYAQTIANTLSIALKSKISKLNTHPMDNKSIYISPLLKNYTIPNDLRNMDSSFRLISRWSTVPFDKSKNIRFFIWWKNKHISEPIDVDLAAVFLSDNMHTVDNLSYTNTTSIYGTFSGDITNAPNGASEYIDIDLTKQKDYRYIMINVFNFTGDTFNNIPEATFGWSTIGTDTAYEPSNVQNRIRLTQEQRSMCACIIDIQECKVHWIELSMNTTNMYSGMNTTNQASLIQMFGTYLKQNDTIKLYDLFRLHAEARQSDIVYTKEESDISYDVDDATVNINDITTILGDYYS